MIALVVLIIFFVIRNKKDKTEFMQDLISNDGVSIPKEPDNEVDLT